MLRISDLVHPHLPPYKLTLPQSIIIPLPLSRQPSGSHPISRLVTHWTLTNQPSQVTHRVSPGIVSNKCLWQEESQHGRQRHPYQPIGIYVYLVVMLKTHSGRTICGTAWIGIRLQSIPWTKGASNPPTQYICPTPLFTGDLDIKTPTKEHFCLRQSSDGK